MLEQHIEYENFLHKQMKRAKASKKSELERLFPDTNKHMEELVDMAMRERGRAEKDGKGRHGMKKS